MYSWLILLELFFSRTRCHAWILQRPCYRAGAAAYTLINVPC